MYYHVIETVQRDGKPAYRLTKTYRRRGFLLRYLFAHTDPVWVIASDTEYLEVSPGSCRLVGRMANYWNSGGWCWSLMASYPVVR